MSEGQKTEGGINAGLVGAELVIRVGVGGRIEVHGPVANKILCYGLLQSAMDAVRNFSAKPSEDGPRVQIVAPIAGLGGGKPS